MDSFSELKQNYQQGWFFFCYILESASLCLENINLSEHDYCAATKNNSKDIYFSNQNNFNKRKLYSESIDFKIKKKPTVINLDHLVHNTLKVSKGKSDRQLNQVCAFKEVQILSNQFSKNAYTIMLKFYKNLSNLGIYQCEVCKEAWPAKTAYKICNRCNRDNKIPKKFSLENNMIPSVVPDELSNLRRDAYCTCITLYECLL